MNLGNDIAVYIDGNLTVNGNVRANYISKQKTNSMFNPYTNIFTIQEEDFESIALGNGTNEPEIYLNNGCLYLFYVNAGGTLYNFGVHYYMESGRGFGYTYPHPFVITTSNGTNLSLRFTYYNYNTHIQMWNDTTSTQVTSGTVYYKRLTY